MFNVLSSVLSNLGVSRLLSPVVSSVAPAIGCERTGFLQARLVPASVTPFRPQTGLFDSKWRSFLALGLCAGLTGCFGDDNEVVNPAPVNCRVVDGGIEDATLDGGDAGADALPPCPDNSDNPPYDPNYPGCSDDYCPGSGDPQYP